MHTAFGPLSRNYATKELEYQTFLMKKAAPAAANIPAGGTAPKDPNAGIWGFDPADPVARQAYNDYYAKGEDGKGPGFMKTFMPGMMGTVPLAGLAGLLGGKKAMLGTGLGLGGLMALYAMYRSSNPKNSIPWLDGILANVAGMSGGFGFNNLGSLFGSETAAAPPSPPYTPPTEPATEPATESPTGPLPPPAGTPAPGTPPAGTPAPGNEPELPTLPPEVSSYRPTKPATPQIGKPYNQVAKTNNGFFKDFGGANGPTFFGGSPRVS